MDDATMTTVMKVGSGSRVVSIHGIGVVVMAGEARVELRTSPADNAIALAAFAWRLEKAARSMREEALARAYPSNPVTIGEVNGVVRELFFTAAGGFARVEVISDSSGHGAHEPGAEAIFPIDDVLRAGAAG